MIAAPAAPLNSDQPALALTPRAAAEALDPCRDAREAFTINEKGLVRLIALLMSLPATTSAATCVSSPTAAVGVLTQDGALRYAAALRRSSSDGRAAHS